MRRRGADICVVCIRVVTAVVDVISETAGASTTLRLTGPRLRTAIVCRTAVEEVQMRLGPGAVHLIVALLWTSNYDQSLIHSIHICLGCFTSASYTLALIAPPMKRHSARSEIKCTPC